MFFRLSGQGRDTAIEGLILVLQCCIVFLRTVVTVCIVVIDLFYKKLRKIPKFSLTSSQVLSFLKFVLCSVIRVPEMDHEDPSSLCITMC